MSDTTIAIRDALTAGLNAQALDVARSALDSAAGDDVPETLYLAALASARMGSIDEAEKWLTQIERQSLRSKALLAEVLSLEGRVAKERYVALRDRTSAAAKQWAWMAIDHYSRAFALGGEAYPAVNAATMAHLAGDEALAQTLARQALSAAPSPEDHWDHASVGEALLLLGHGDEARDHYREAYRLASNRFGDVASMRHQLQLLGSAAALELTALLPAPAVVAFSGHMIDDRGRAAPRFPAELETAVAAALRAKIDALGPALGYSQAACGSDILFLEIMQAAGMQTQIVLPFGRADFIETSVRFAGESWVRRFEQVVAGANRVVVATEESFNGDDVLFEHASNLIQGMAFLRARQLATTALMLTVVDHQASAIVGGTTATARNWIQKGGRIDSVDLDALRADRMSPSPIAQSPVAPEPVALRPAVAAEGRTNANPRSIRSLLFADISGFSKMPEQYAPAFAEMFLGTCKTLLDSFEHRPLHANPHGDGLFLVFDLPSHAADFAVLMQQRLSQFDWSVLGLAADTGARIALHTGPLFRVFDPVTDRFTFYGTHVNRAARLEPIVRPRQIFATEEFAASLVAENQDRFVCDYIGTMKLAKQFGEARLYRLRWLAEA